MGQEAWTNENRVKPLPIGAGQELHGLENLSHELEIVLHTPTPLYTHTHVLCTHTHACTPITHTYTHIHMYCAHIHMHAQPSHTPLYTHLHL